MKVLIVSDIHGNFECMKKVIQNDTSFDKLLILGDVLSGPKSSGYNPKQLALFLNLYKDKILAVRGNCDYDISPLDFSIDHSFLLVPIDDKLFLMTHGNYYFPSHPPEGVDFDVFLYGHSHVSTVDKMNDKIYLNPGSISNPRRGVRSYLVYEDGEFQLKSVDDNKVLRKIK